MNNAKPLADTDKKKTQARSGGVLLLTWASENPSHEPSILPALLKLKVAIVVITALQRNKRRNTSFIELDGDESKCCVKVDTYEI